VPQKRTNHGNLLVANQQTNSLEVIDADAGRLLFSIPTRGTRGHEVAVLPNTRLAYVPIYGDSVVGQPGTDGRTVEVIDVDARRVVSSIDLGRAVRPHMAIFGPDGMLYVTAELANAIDIVDPRSQKRVASIPTLGPQSHMMVITRDGSRGYVTNIGTGTVTALDLVNRKNIAVIPIAKSVQRISISADDHTVFTADQTSPRLAAIDTSTNQVKNWIKLPAIGYGSRATPDGRWLLVALPKSNQVAVVDLRSMKVARTVDVPANPQEILLRPGHHVAYISCFSGGKITELDLRNWQINKSIEVGAGADGLAWLTKQD
jgi:DNA-binding beta-propeller fold protein YncE